MATEMRSPGLLERIQKLKAPVRKVGCCLLEIGEWFMIIGAFLPQPIALIESAFYTVAGLA